MDLLVTCTCGHQTTVSEYAVGMTAPCPQCGRPLTVSRDNAKPVTGAPAPTIETKPAGESDVVYTPLQTSSLKTHCARCGREFRGDWDRHSSAIGLVCNICRNLVTSKQTVQSTGYVAPVDSMKLDPVIDPIPPRPVEVEEVEKTWMEKYWPDKDMMRRIAIGAAAAFALYTVWLLVSGAWQVGPGPEGEKTAATAATHPPALPAWAGVLVTILQTCSGFTSAYVGLYIFLTLSNRLPESTVLANLIRMLPGVAIITVLYFAASVLPVPFIGLIVTVVFVPAVVFVSFGFEAQDILNFPIGMLLGGMLQFLAHWLIYWVIGAVAL